LKDEEEENGEEFGLGTHNIEDLEGNDEIKESEAINQLTRETRTNADIMRTK
jgi:hypothetical protein